eukprot:scaffold122430_cov19-Tisochrysis_lutea.AAC.1
MSSPVVGSPLAAANSSGTSVNTLLQKPHQQHPQALGLGAMVLPGGGGSLPTLSPSSKAPKSPNMLVSLQQQQQQAGGQQMVMAPGGGGGGRLESRTFARLSPKLRMEVHRLLSMVPGLKV